METAKPKLKPRGAPQNVREKMARLDVLAHKAIRFWEKTLDDNSQATTGEKIQVSKLVVEYAWGKPKQQVQVDARVELNHTAHLQALHNLVVAAHGPMIDAKPLNQLDNLDHVINPPVLSRGEMPTDFVEIGRLDGLAAPEAGGSDHPPPPGRNPGGDLVMEQPSALDTKK